MAAEPAGSEQRGLVLLVWDVDLGPRLDEQPRDLRAALALARDRPMQRGVPKHVQLVEIHPPPTIAAQDAPHLQHVAGADGRNQGIR